MSKSAKELSDKEQSSDYFAQVRLQRLNVFEILHIALSLIGTGILRTLFYSLFALFAVFAITFALQALGLPPHRNVVLAVCFIPAILGASLHALNSVKYEVLCVKSIKYDKHLMEQCNPDT